MEIIRTKLQNLRKKQIRKETYRKYVNIISEQTSKSIRKSMYWLNKILEEEGITIYEPKSSKRSK